MGSCGESGSPSQEEEKGGEISVLGNAKRLETFKYTSCYNHYLTVKFELFSHMFYLLLFAYSLIRNYFFNQWIHSLMSIANVFLSLVIYIFQNVSRQKSINFELSN